MIKPELVRRLRELAWAIRSRPVTVIFLGARFPDIPELEKEVKILDLPLPEEAETADILNRDATFAQWTRAKSFDGFGPFGPAIPVCAPGSPLPLASSEP